MKPRRMVYLLQSHLPPERGLDSGRNMGNEGDGGGNDMSVWRKGFSFFLMGCMEVEYIKQCRNRTQNLTRILGLGQKSPLLFPYHILFLYGGRAWKEFLARHSLLHHAVFREMGEWMRTEVLGNKKRECYPPSFLSAFLVLSFVCMAKISWL